MKNIENMGLDNIDEITKKTNERFSVDEKNIEMVLLKNKLGIPAGENLPEGVAGFLNIHKDLQEMQNAVGEAATFINAVKKAEQGNYKNMEKGEILALKLVPKDQIDQFVSEWATLKGIDSRKEDKNNVWFQKGLHKAMPEDLSMYIDQLKQKFEQSYKSIKEKEEYEISILTDYGQRLELLQSLNLPEGYNAGSMIDLIKSNKKEAENLLQKKKVA